MLPIITWATNGQCLRAHSRQASAITAAFIKKVAMAAPSSVMLKGREDHLCLLA